VDDWVIGKQSSELLLASRRFACVEYCLKNEILWMNSAWAMYQALIPENSQDIELVFPQDTFPCEAEKASPTHSLSQGK